MFQHCPVYPCNCARCRTGIDMGLVRLVRDKHMALVATRAGACVVDDCTTVLENDSRYPDVTAVALARLQAATGLIFS